MALILFENNVGSNDGAKSLFAPEHRIAQTFTPSISHNVEQVDVVLIKIGTPGTITLSIEGTVAGEPDGVVLISQTKNIDGDPNSVTAWYEFAFATSYWLTAGVQYAIVLKAAGVSNNSNDYLRWWYESGNPYAGGQSLRSSDSGVNWTSTTDDQNFKEWGGDTTPVVTTQAVTAISGTTATGNGTITSLGDSNPTQHGHCWNTAGTPTTADSKTQNGAASAIGAFTSAITGLVAGTKYYVRAYATNAAGTSYGGQVEFWANKGTVFPSDPLLRASGIKRSFWAGIGGNAIYQVELTLGGISTTYVSPIGEREPPSAIKPTPLPTGAGYQQSDYERWLANNDIADIIRLFGKIPNYQDWLSYRRFSQGGFIR